MECVLLHLSAWLVAASRDVNSQGRPGLRADRERELPYPGSRLSDRSRNRSLGVYIKTEGESGASLTLSARTTEPQKVATYRGHQRQRTCESANKTEQVVVSGLKGESRDRAVKKSEFQGE